MQFCTYHIHETYHVIFNIELNTMKSCSYSTRKLFGDPSSSLHYDPQCGSHLCWGRIHHYSQLFTKTASGFTNIDSNVY